MESIIIIHSSLAQLVRAPDPDKSGGVLGSSPRRGASKAAILRLFLYTLNLMYWIYILYSDKIDKYYIGYTSNIHNRLEFHNSEYNKIWSKRGKPWKLVFSHQFDTKKEALSAEKFIKKQKSKKFISNLIETGWSQSL